MILEEFWRFAQQGAPSRRFQHFTLPDDVDNGYRALVYLTRTGARHVLASTYEQDRLHDLVAQHGFSHHPLHGGAPSSGFMVAYDAPKHSGIAVVHHMSELTPDHIGAHREAIAHHLDKPDSFQGGWHDTATGDVYLDASRHFPQKKPALDFAAHEKQKAIFNLNDFSEHFMNPHQDPLAQKDLGAWHERYKDTGTEPHPGFAAYAHRYPDTDEQQAFWRQHGQLHSGAIQGLGTPMGPWRDEGWVGQQVRR